MEKTTIDQIHPLPGWALCESLLAKRERQSGLLLGREVEDGKTTEGVARVHAVEWEVRGVGIKIDPGFKEGDLILIRDFLKFANQVGDLVKADRGDRFFLLNNKDALCVVEGPGTIGFYDEYVLPGS